MKKLLLTFGLAVVLVLGLTARSEAAILINFDEPDFTADVIDGDYSHTFTTVLGDIHFNGQITNILAGEETPDHTTGQANFLKNTEEEDTLTILFDFPVPTFSIWVRTPSQDFAINGEAYDGEGNLIGSGNFDITEGGVWHFSNVDDLAGAARKLIIYSSSGDGDNFAIDDLTLNTGVVPEPASMLLFGSGLVGALVRRKRNG